MYTQHAYTCVYRFCLNSLILFHNIMSFTFTTIQYWIKVLHMNTTRWDATATTTSETRTYLVRVMVAVSAQYYAITKRNNWCNCEKTQISCQGYSIGIGNSIIKLCVSRKKCLRYSMTWLSVKYYYNYYKYPYTYIIYTSIFTISIEKISG